MSPATSQHILLLVGSPKGLSVSRSATLGGIVVEGLEARGWSAEVLPLHAAVVTIPGREQLLVAVERADVVLLAAPLYVDSLPAPAIAALELLHRERRNRPSQRRTRFVSLIQCGFLEPHQNDTAQEIVRRFAEPSGFEWAASVSIGGGRTSKRHRQALDMVAEALDLDLLVPGEVDRLTRKPAMPRWAYILGGNAMWRRMAGEHDARDRLRARPYERADG